MADVQTLSDISNLKNSKILVNVDEALRDVLVVSYEFDSKLYQGVLLDSTKRGLPCGIFTPSNCPDAILPTGECLDEDKTHSVSQRYTYFQEKSPPQGKDSLALAPGTAYHMRRAMRGTGQARFKNSRMTVRLRPRQVLCSKCRSICNENSENVDLSKKRKGEETSTAPSAHSRLDKRIASTGHRHLSPKSPRTLFSENQRDNQSLSNSVSPMTRKRTLAMQSMQSVQSVDSTVLRPSLIPKLTRLESNELPGSVNSSSQVKVSPGYWTSPNPSDCTPATKGVVAPPEKEGEGSGGDGDGEEGVDCVDVVSESKHSDVSESGDSKEKVSEGGDDAVEPELGGGDAARIAEGSHDVSVATSTGSEADDGQDGHDHDRMVLRKKRNVGSMEDLWDESVFTEDSVRLTTPVIKISFGSQGEGTVLKIPAKVRTYHMSESDTEEAEADGENENAQLEVRTKDAINSAKAAKRALKRAKKEARRKIGGGTSPARSLGGSSPAYETLYHRRHKRKVKHKKRHKEARANKHGGEDAPVDPDAEDGIVDVETVEMKNGGETYSAIKERCLKQKLSISLRKLNATAYARMTCGDAGSSAGSNSPGSNSELSGADGADEVPDFPAPPVSHPLMMRVSTQTVGSCLTGDGRTMEVGDVVWGKVHGFPWWPGKVLSISISRKEDGVTMAPQAHVAWYGSSTSSLMPCDELSPFLETFKTRYNKKKRGPYKEAIRQATCEARKEDHRDPLKEVDVAS